MYSVIPLFATALTRFGVFIIQLPRKEGMQIVAIVILKSKATI
jgi:hypothetical protein